MDNALSMKEIQAQQDLARDSSNVSCLAWVIIDSYCFSIRHHNWQHKTKVGAVWAFVLKIIQQFQNMSSTWVLKACLRQMEKNSKLLAIF